MPATISPSILSDVETIQTSDRKIKWYMMMIVSAAAMNYPDVVPQIWQHLSTHLFPTMDHTEQLDTARKVREALTKSCGIIGAAKTGTAIRLLSQHTPTSLLDTAAPRASEDPVKAEARGKAFHARIYGQNQEFDMDATGKASPDYVYVVRSILYARIFSFDVILDDLETGYVIVAALIGNDCPLQCRHHMKGMLYNGASHDDLFWITETCLKLARDVGADKGWRNGGRVEIPFI